MRIGISPYFSAVLPLLMLAGGAYAHEGPLDAYGCHYDRDLGGYHCHRGTFAGHYFDSKEEMLQMMQLHMSEPRPAQEREAGERDTGEGMPDLSGGQN